MDSHYSNQAKLEAAIAEQARIIREQEELDRERAQIEYMLYVQSERDKLEAARNTLAGYYYCFK